MEMPADRDKHDRQRRRLPQEGERNEVRPAGGSYGDRQAQYGTGAPRWQEPIPGSDERGEFGAGGEAFGSWTGQGRYAPDADQQRHTRGDQPDTPAWPPFDKRQANPPGEPEEARRRDFAHDPHYQNWGNRAMRQHDEDYRAFRAEQQRKLAEEFEAWRRARAIQTSGREPDDPRRGVHPSSADGDPNRLPDTSDKTKN